MSLRLAKRFLRFGYSGADRLPRNRIHIGMIGNTPRWFKDDTTTKAGVTFGQSVITSLSIDTGEGCLKVSERLPISIIFQ